MPQTAIKQAVRHVLTSDQFDASFVESLFEHADLMRKNLESDRRYHRLGNTLTGQILYRLFYKESTRTYESFGFAATHLGMSVLGTQTVQFSSVAKGETLEDTIQVINSYFPSLIVLRSANVGDADRAAAVSKVPIINAGDGSGEHPTQGLLDLYTIQNEVGRLTNLHIVAGGDMWNARTARSMVKLAALFPGNRFTFVAPPTFEMRDDVVAVLKRAGSNVEQTTEVADALRSADVVYWTRVQTERLTDQQKEFIAKNPKVQDKYTIGPQQMKLLKPTARLMHPLPRNAEISTQVDSDPRAAYIRQTYYGMLVRMALIEWTLGYL